MTDDQKRAASKRQARVTEARLASKRARKHATNYPHATSTQIITDLRLAIEGLLAELEEPVPS